MTATIQSVKSHTEDGGAVRVTTDEGEEIVPAGHRGLADWLAAGGAIAPYYTIVGAEYANAEGTAFMAITEEAGRVLVTRSPGKADRWAALQKWLAGGGTIAPYVPQPVVPAPDPAAELAALKRALIEKSVLTQVEIDEAVKGKAG